MDNLLPESVILRDGLARYKLLVCYKLFKVTDQVVFVQVSVCTETRCPVCNHVCNHTAGLTVPCTACLQQMQIAQWSRMMGRHKHMQKRRTPAQSMVAILSQPWRVQGSRVLRASTSVGQGGAKSQPLNKNMPSEGLELYCSVLCRSKWGKKSINLQGRGV